MRELLNIQQNKFFSKLIKNTKKNIKEKYFMCLGTNIQILKHFYCSLNPTIKKYFMCNEFDNKVKEIFIDFINPKLTRELLDDYDYSFSEICNSVNDNNTTYDGNDSGLDINYDSFNQLIIKFLNKIETIKKDIDKSKIIDNNKNTGTKRIKQIKEQSEIEKEKNIIKEKRIIIENKNEENNFSLHMTVDITLDE